MSDCSAVPLARLRSLWQRVPFRHVTAMDLHFECHMLAALVFLVIPNLKHAINQEAPLA